MSTPSFNCNFDTATNAKLAGLVGYIPVYDHIRIQRKRKSKLDSPHLSEMLKMRDKGWSYQCIADILKKEPGCERLNRSTVMRRLKRFKMESK